MAVLLFPQALFAGPHLLRLKHVCTVGGAKPIAAGWSDNPIGHGDGWIFPTEASFDHTAAFLFATCTPWIYAHASGQTITFWPVRWNMGQKNGMPFSETRVLDQARRAGWFDQHPYTHTPSTHQTLSVLAHTKPIPRTYLHLPR